MTSAAAVITSPSPAAAATGAAEPAAWLMDERDGFISWLRGEFAAANAVIDLLLVHLRTTVGDPGEYDHVTAAVQQRRHHWAPVIHMQQFFSVADVAYALQQAGWRRRAQPAQALGAAASPAAPPPPSPRRSGLSQTHHSHQHHRHGGHYRHDTARGAGPVAGAGSEKDGRQVHNNKEWKGPKEAENMVDTKSLQLDSLSLDGEKHSKPQAFHEGSSKVVPTPVEYSTSEIIDGKTVNSVEGLKVYEGLVNVIETNKILSLVNETKASFRRGGLEAGHTVIIGKRPMKGHGREIVQLGVPIIEGPPDDENQSPETTVDAIPELLHDLFDRLSQQDIIPFKPDYCVIDFFNEGDFSLPHHSLPWYGRPLCTLCLTDCDMVFGRAITGERGDHRGPLKLSLTAGSLLLLQGKSVEYAKRAIPAERKPRVLLNFGKSVAGKHIPAESVRFTPSISPPMPWGPSSRPTNIARHPHSPKHFGYAPASGVLPAPAVGPHHVPPSDGMQPVYVATAPVSAAAIPFTPAVPLPNTTAAWIPEAAPRPAPPRFPGPGTGVFLPPGSGHPLPHQMMQASHGEPKSPQGSSSYLHNKITGKEISNGNHSPKSSPTKRSYTTEEKPECNGSSNGGSIFEDEKSGVGKEQQNGSLKNVGSSKVQPHGHATK